ncbi:sideroflexin-5-like [Anneissia japonica]|uniref:sideroflexin-5-like n=1 Tax=Anneissia japonica TaxID=1529436 RepID=UPI0014255B70|nr:sideroflexin-5-like [Anneissia japonica]
MVNYSNRNASKETPMGRFVMGYIGAVGSACSIAVSLNVLLKRATKLKTSTKFFVQRFVPFPAVGKSWIYILDQYFTEIGIIQNYIFNMQNNSMI